MGESWSRGDVLYASPTTAGALTNIKPTPPDFSIPVGAVVFARAVDGWIFSRPILEQQQYYGQFARTTNAALIAANTAYVVEFDALPAPD